MIHNFQKIRDINITGAMTGLLRMRSPFSAASEIKALGIWFGAALTDEVIINISKNGVQQLSGTDRLIISAGATSGTLTGLAISLALGDKITVDVESVGAGVITAGIEVNLAIDDLVVASGLTEENVQDIVAAMMISGNNSSWIYDDAAGTLKVDAPQLTDEQIQDKVALMLASGTNVNVNYDDGTGIVTISSTTRSNEEIMDVIAAMLQEGSNISLVYADLADTLTITATGSGGGGSLDDLSDVTVSAPQVDQALIWNGTEWINQDQAAAPDLAQFVTTEKIAFTKQDLFEDGFESAGVPDPAVWDTVDGSNINAAAGLMHLASNDLSGYADLYSVAFNLRGAMIMIEVDSFPVDADSGITFVVQGNTNIDALFCFADHGTWTINHRIGGVNSAEIFPAFDPDITAMRARHDEDSDVMFFETYKDGSWTILHQFDCELSDFLDDANLNVGYYNTESVDDDYVLAAMRSSIILSETDPDPDDVLAYNVLRKRFEPAAPAAGGGFTTEQIQDLVAAMFISGSNTSWIYDDAAGTLKVDAVQLTDEEIQDKVAALITGGANTTVTYNDGANTLTIAETTAGKTQEEIEDIVAALLQQGSNITLTYNDAGNQLTIAASGGSGSATEYFCLVKKSANQSVANNTWTIMTFEAEISDTQNMHSTSSNTSRITIPVDGNYLINAQLYFSNNGAGFRFGAVYVNGSIRGEIGAQTSPNSSFQTRCNFSGVLPLVAGDYVEIGAFQNSGGAINVESTSDSTVFSVKKI